MSVLYKIGFACADKVIFQNTDDKEQFIKENLVKADKCCVVNGSGVNMKEFCQKSIERMVCVVPGNAFLTDLEADTQSFRINFSTPTNEQLEKGIIALGELAKEYINKD